MYQNPKKIAGFFLAIVIWTLNTGEVFAQCGNLDLEAGNFNGWTGYTGCISSSGTITINTPGIVPQRHTIMSGTGTDPLIPAIPVVSPYGGLYSVRLGNANVGYGAEKLVYSFTVDPQSPVFTYQYAVVLQDPGTSHGANEKPRFDVQVLGPNGNVIPCGDYHVVAGGSIPGFQNAGTLTGYSGTANTTSCQDYSGASSDAVRYKNWSMVAIDLTPYVGSQVTVQFSVTDCAQGGHFGYAYIDASCGPLSIAGHYCPGDINTTLTAPPGFQSYQWSIGGTTQSITINNPQQMEGDTVSVICTPYQGGAACATTLYYVFELSPEVQTDFNVNTSCGITDASFIDASIIGTGSIDSWSWWVDGTYAGNSAVLDYTFPAPGNYDITLTSNSVSGCPDTITKTVYISSGLSAIAATPAGYGISCPGRNDGYATVKVITGNPPYIFSWNNGTYSTDSIYGLYAGDYTIEITDSTGCHFYDTLSILEPPPISESPVKRDIICYGVPDGKIELNPAGGVPPYSFAWSHSPSLNADSATGLIAGTYSFTITDSHNCSFDSAITLSQPSAPFSVTATHTNAICFGGNQGSASVTNVTGNTPGYTYAWNSTPIQTSSSISNLTAGNYLCTITDVNGCSTNISQTVSQPAQIALNLSVTDIRCFGETSGSLAVVASGGTPAYVYSLWQNNTMLYSNNNGFFSNLSAGTYLIQSVDNNNCIVNRTATVNEPNALSITLIADSVNCYKYDDGQIFITASGGTPPYTYNVAGFSQNSTGAFSGIAAGEYNLHIQDINGCFLDSSTIIYEPAPLEVTANPDSLVAYLGETKPILLNSNYPSSSVHYQWQPTNGLDCSTCDAVNVYALNSGYYTVNAVIHPHNLDCELQVRIPVTVIPDYSLYIPNAFSPNNNGANDFYEVFGKKEGWANMNFKIFNRWGELVFESSDPNFKWDGTFKGVSQPPMVYVYEMALRFLDGHKIPLKMGSITLIR